MVKFVTLRTTEGREIQVNPDRVAYVRKKTAGVAVVFDGVAGGVHELLVLGAEAEVIGLLERRPVAKAKAAAARPAP